MTEAGNFLFLRSGTSCPAFGVRDALMPFTAPALLANLTGEASLDACPSEAKPSRATSTAATPSAIGNRRLIVVLLSFDP